MNDYEMKQKEINTIKNKVYTIRNQKVMLDSDLAEIYGYQVKRLNEQVKRNINRFPEDFMFQLSEEEVNNLWSQIATTNISTMARTNPYVFTEQGIYMLATVLKGELAVQQSIFIMRAFKEMKDFLVENKHLLSSEEKKMLIRHDNEIKEINIKIDEINKNFINDKETKAICILNGQKLEADIAYSRIFRKAKKTIFLIDDYVGEHTLELLKEKNINVDVTLISKNIARKGITKILFDDFNEEYPTLRIKTNRNFHDRFIILDYKTDYEKIFVLGSSMNDAGKKISVINSFEDKEILRTKIEEVLAEHDTTF